MPLDLRASRAVYAARLFERAVNDPGPWFIEWAGMRLRAQRAVTEHGIEFTATVPAIASRIRESEAGRLMLLCRNDVVSVREAPTAMEAAGGFRIGWQVALSHA